jgi:hypothetical protein
VEAKVKAPAWFLLALNIFAKKFKFLRVKQANYLMLSVSEDLSSLLSIID